MTTAVRRRTLIRMIDDQLCRCGHPESAHEHFRRGRDCGACGADGCPRFEAELRPVAGTTKAAPAGQAML